MERLRRWLVRVLARALEWLLDTAGTGAVPWGPDGVNSPAFRVHEYEGLPIRRDDEAPRIDWSKQPSGSPPLRRPWKREGE